MWEDRETYWSLVCSLKIHVSVIWRAQLVVMDSSSSLMILSALETQTAGGPCSGFIASGGKQVVPRTKRYESGRHQPNTNTNIYIYSSAWKECHGNMTSLKRSLPSDGQTSNLSSKVYVRTTRNGKVQKIVRELYLRQDIPCSSKLCSACLVHAPTNYRSKRGFIHCLKVTLNTKLIICSTTIRLV